MVLPGGLEGPPTTAVRERGSGGRHGRRAVLLKIPALPEATECHPTPASSPSLPPHPTQIHTRWKAEPWQSLGKGEQWRGRCEERHTPALQWDRAKGRPDAGLSYMGMLGRLKVPISPPSPGLGDCPQPTTIPYPAPPQPAPPQITTRGREKGAIYRCRPCGCPNRAGWGGLGNSWGPGEEAGFPGGGHGTAYLEPPSLPEHAHRPHTHHHGVI